MYPSNLSYSNYPVLNWKFHSPPCFFSLQKYHCFLRKHLSWTSSTGAWLSESLLCCSLNSNSVFASKLYFPGATPSQSLNVTGILTSTQEHSYSCPWLQDSQVPWPMSLRQHCRISCSHTTFSPLRFPNCSSFSLFCLPPSFLSYVHFSRYVYVAFLGVCFSEGPE